MTALALELSSDVHDVYGGRNNHVYGARSNHVYGACSITSVDSRSVSATKYVWPVRCRVGTTLTNSLPATFRRYDLLKYLKVGLPMTVGLDIKLLYVCVFLLCQNQNSRGLSVTA